MKAKKPWDYEAPAAGELYIHVEAISTIIETHGHQDWRDEASCASAGVDLEWFFGDSSMDAVLNTRRARGVCAACPVKRPCLSFALDHDADGIWAGTTTKQRRQTFYMTPQSERITYLLEMAREASTTGPWRSATPEQWRETG